MIGSIRISNKLLLNVILMMKVQSSQFPVSQIMVNSSKLLLTQVLRLDMILFAMTFLFLTEHHHLDTPLHLAQMVHGVLSLALEIQNHNRFQ